VGVPTSSAKVTLCPHCPWRPGLTNTHKRRLRLLIVSDVVCPLIGMSGRNRHKSKSPHSRWISSQNSVGGGQAASNQNHHVGKLREFHRVATATKLEPL